MGFNNRPANDNWRKNFKDCLGGIRVCAEDFCDNTFLINSTQHKYCDECRKERKRLKDRQYDAKRRVARIEARRKVRLERKRQSSDMIPEDERTSGESEAATEAEHPGHPR